MTQKRVMPLPARHPELAKSLVEMIVTIANSVRESTELSAGLYVRATEEGRCRCSGHFDDMSTDRAVWSIIQRKLKDEKN